MSVVALWVSMGSLLAALVAQSLYFHRRLAQWERANDRVMMLYIQQLQTQLSAQQRDLLQLAHRLDEHLTLSSEESITSPYNRAIELIRQGLNATEVASRCDISRSEAELIYSLYRNGPTS